MDREGLAAYGCKFEYASQCDDVLRDRIIVPVKRGMRRRFLEKDRLRFDQFTSVHAATYHVGISVRTGVETISLNHCVTSSMLLMFNTAAVSARTRWHRAAFSARD